MAVVLVPAAITTPSIFPHQPASSFHQCRRCLPLLSTYELLRSEPDRDPLDMRPLLIVFLQSSLALSLSSLALSFSARTTGPLGSPRALAVNRRTDVGKGAKKREGTGRGCETPVSSEGAREEGEEGRASVAEPAGEGAGGARKAMHVFMREFFEAAQFVFFNPS